MTTRLHVRLMLYGVDLQIWRMWNLFSFITFIYFCSNFPRKIYLYEGNFSQRLEACLVILACETIHWRWEEKGEDLRKIAKGLWLRGWVKQISREVSVIRRYSRYF